MGSLFRVIIFTLFLQSSTCFAGFMRANLELPFSYTYTQTKLTNTYSVTGWGLGMDFFGDNESGYSTGLGFSLGDYKAKGKSLGNSILFPSSFKYQDYRVHYIIAIPIYPVRIEIPITLSWLKQTSDTNEGDEKYGYGLGLQLHFPIFNSFTLAAGYEQLSYPNGKNVSNGEAGTLAYPIKTTQTKILLSYVLSLGGSTGLSGAGAVE